MQFLVWATRLGSCIFSHTFFLSGPREPFESQLRLGRSGCCLDERERDSARSRARPRARDDQTAGYCCPTAGTDVREHAYFVQNTVDVSELHRYLISCLFFFVCSINSALEPFRDPFISLCWVNSWQFVCVPSVHLFLLQPEVSMASRATGHIISL